MSRSIAEAKYHALASTIAKLMRFVHLLKNIGHCVPPPKLYCDNISAIHMDKNLVFHHCTKYIEIDGHFVQERIASGALSFGIYSRIRSHIFPNQIKLQISLQNHFVLQHLH